MKWLIALFISLSVFLTCEYFNLRDKHNEALEEISQMLAENSVLRTQYRVINDILLFNTQSEKETEKKTKELKGKINDVQNKSNQPRRRIPDDINNGLRERVKEVNGAATRP